MGAPLTPSANIIITSLTDDDAVNEVYAKLFAEQEVRVRHVQC